MNHTREGIKKRQRSVNDDDEDDDIPLIQLDCENISQALPNLNDIDMEDSL